MVSIDRLKLHIEPKANKQTTEKQPHHNNNGYRKHRQE